MSKWTEKRPHISLGFIKTDLETKIGVDNKFYCLAIDHLAGIETEIEAIIIITIGITGPTIEIGLGIITNVITEVIPTGLMKDAIAIDKITEGERQLQTE